MLSSATCINSMSNFRIQENRENIGDLYAKVHKRPKRVKVNHAKRASVLPCQDEDIDALYAAHDEKVDSLKVDTASPKLSRTGAIYKGGRQQLTMFKTQRFITEIEKSEVALNKNNNFEEDLYAVVIKSEVRKHYKTKNNQKLEKCDNSCAEDICCITSSIGSETTSEPVYWILEEDSKSVSSDTDTGSLGGGWASNTSSLDGGWASNSESADLNESSDDDHIYERIWPL